MESIEPRDLAEAVSHVDPSSPKLLIVGAFPPPHKHIYGGMVTACRALLRSSLSEKIQIILVDSTQVSNPPPGLLWRLILSIKRMFLYLVILNRSRPDAVMLFTATGASVLEKGAMAWVARLLGTPSLLFPRGGALVSDFHGSGIYRFFARASMRGASKILCQGESWQRFAINSLDCEPSDAPIVRNWTATSELLNIGELRDRRSPSIETRLLFVGWLDREKGVLDILDACKELIGKYKFQLDLVGEGNVSTIAKRHAKDMGLSRVVKFHGWLRGDALLRAYKDADIFVLPSWVEGLPNAMIEAMAARLPVIVTSVGNIPEIIMDGDNGLLVTPCSPTELESAIERLLVDDALRMKIADKAYETATKKFGVERAVDKIINIVNEIKI